MENIEESSVEDDSSAFDPLPDEIVLQIFNKIIDSEALCSCKLVSKRFHRITHQVDTIRFITEPSTSFYSVFACHAVFAKFRGLKYIFIHILASPNHPYPVKWKINFGEKLDSLLFLSPNSVYHSKECVDENSHEEEDTELNREKYYTAMSCLDDAVMSHDVFINCIHCIPLLEKVTLTDSHKTFRISLDAEKIAEMRECVTLMRSGTFPDSPRRNRVRKCYIPLLELPVSGYVMKGVTLYLMEREDLRDDGMDTFMNTDNDFEDKEEAAYNEAVAEIFMKHRAQIKRQDDFTSVANCFL